jgi:extracellular elastinolytic metalloproteinase
LYYDQIVGVLQAFCYNAFDFMRTQLRFPFLLFMMITTLSAMAQERSPRTIAIQHLRDHAARYQLQPTDVAAVRVTDEYRSDNNGVTHVWLQQEHLGVPVFNGLFGLHVLPSGEVVTTSHRFVEGLATKVNTTLPSLAAPQALQMAMQHLGMSHLELPAVRTKHNAQNWVFEGGQVSRTDIPVTACYVPMPDGTVHLAWMLVIDQVGSSDMWSIRVDARTGQILDKNNRTLYCRAGSAHRHDESCMNTSKHTPVAAPSTTSESVVLNGSYRVFPLPTESPAHGQRALVVNPASPQFSPYGWHDTNGQAGPEFTYTRGNNVWAYTDTGNDNTGTEAESAAGGAGLVFDFPFDQNLEPIDNRNAAVTNLFYMNNMIHDITALYGFTEQAGNFQVRNYTNQGAGNDAVRAEALDGGGQDDANFSTPADGGAPRMQMYRWSSSGGNVVVVNSPSQIAGVYFGQQAGNWGVPITATPVTGDGVIVLDGTDNPTLGCFEPVVDLNNKIALVQRGECQFGEKAYLAQQAGAKACIICNFADDTEGMLPGDFGAQITIPVLMMSRINCEALRQFAGQGLNISLVQPPAVGPDFYDGDYDNGIIAHEYAHGISNRLTGGPSQADCLNNEEQMGEGWSDFFSLIMTVRPGDVAEKRRGIATYVLREPNEGIGIRRYPYSTDMTIAPLTFGNVAENTGEHAIGEVWNNMLWDLYWAMVDKYGFDADITNTNSGNGRAIQLVMDGMKLQPCSPGFKDGFNAIMTADRINYGGADTCLISQVFARRGLGEEASQGSSASAGDGREHFDPIATCIKALKIRKETTTPVINPGQTATWKIIVNNHKDEIATGVVVTDELPDGLQFVSASMGGVLQNNNTVVWNLGDIPPGQIRILTLNAKSITAGSPSLYLDDMDNEGDWFPLSIEPNVNTIFALQSSTVKVGSNAWQAPAEGTITDMVLEKQSQYVVDGDKPVMRFWTQFNTQAGADAGFIEFRKKGAQSWVRIAKEATFRGGYTGGVTYGTFAIPFLSGFSGNSNGWRQAYADLSEFAGDTLDIRFRFGTDASTAGIGWFIDQVEMIDMINFDTEACLTSTQGDQACDRAPERGVILNPGPMVSTDEPMLHIAALHVQPNPANDNLYITHSEAITGSAQVTLSTADGRMIRQVPVRGLAANQPFQLHVQDVPAGLYIVRLEAQNTTGVARIVIRH